MTRWRDNFTLQLTAILLVIGLLPLLIFFSLSYQTTQRAVLQVASAHNMEILSGQKEYINLQTEQVEALAANVGQVDEISAALSLSGPDNPSNPSNNSYDELATKARLGYLLSNYRNLKGLVSIDVFALNGEHYHVGDSLSNTGARSELRDTLLARTFQSGASVVWHGVEDNIQSSSRTTKVLVATKLLVRPDSSWLKAEPVGMLVVNFSTDHLHDHFDQVNLGDDAHLLVLDDQRRLIYSPNFDKTGTRVPDDFSRLLVGASGSALHRINDQDMLLSYEQISDKNWYVVSLVPEATLLAPMVGIQRMGWVLLAVSVALTLLLIHLFTARVLKPIGAIADGFQRFQQGALDLSWRMHPPRSLPQVQDLVHWFNAFLESMAKRRDADTRLRIAATAFESHQGMLVTNAQRVILQVNHAFTTLTGYSAEEAIGQTPHLMNSGLHDTEFFTQLNMQLKATGSWRGEIWNRRKDGGAYLEWLTITGVKNEFGEVTHYVGTMTDITQRKAAEEEIKILAFYDPLTGLPNRRLLDDRLKLAAANSGRRQQCGALMLLDLDKFKVINDTLGHAMGDLLLRQVAKRLVDRVREGDTVARQGGDEFVVLLEGLSPNAEDAANQARQIGQEMIKTLSEPYDLHGSPCQSSASFGVTIFSSAESSVDELMKQADIAMYQAKDSGRNALRFFDPHMQKAVVARAALEADMRQALAQDQFVLHFQPVMCGQVVRGAEVLVRWQHPQRGLVMPSVFIPLAEETGLIVPLGNWVLRAACEQLAQWADVPAKAPWVLSVNVSVKQFRQPDFVSTVVHTMETTGVNPARLKLEVTESLFISDMEDVIDKMNQLQAKGLQFSLDDFGTGYSSLTYLKRMPLSELKIDQSFVRDILTDPSDAITVRTILGLGHSMGLEVLAEGVETEGQLAFLEANGCDLIQGYLFSRPLPAADLDAWLAQRD